MTLLAIGTVAASDSQRSVAARCVEMGFRSRPVKGSHMAALATTAFWA